MGDKRKLYFGQKVLYSLGSTGLNIVSISVASWLTYFYMPPGKASLAPVWMISLALFLAGLRDGFIKFTFYPFLL